MSNYLISTTDLFKSLQDLDTLIVLSFSQAFCWDFLDSLKQERSLEYGVEQGIFDFYLEQLSDLDGVIIVP